MSNARAKAIELYVNKGVKLVKKVGKKELVGVGEMYAMELAQKIAKKKVVLGGTKRDLFIQKEYKKQYPLLKKRIIKGMRKKLK